MGEGQRMWWDAMCQSLLASGHWHMAKGLVVGAVLPKLEQHEDSVLHGRLCCDMYKYGCVSPRLIGPSLAVLCCASVTDRNICLSF